jgi:hypothetical protein
MIAIALLVPALVAAAIFVPLHRRTSTVRTRVSDYVSMPDQDAAGRSSRQPCLHRHRAFARANRWWQRFKDTLQFADVPFPPVQVAFGTLILTLLAMWILSLIATPLALFGLAGAADRPFGDPGENHAKAPRLQRTAPRQPRRACVGPARRTQPRRRTLRSSSPMRRSPRAPSSSGSIADEQLGVPLDVALDKVVERMKNRDLEQVALVASVQSETGGKRRARCSTRSP